MHKISPAMHKTALRLIVAAALCAGSAPAIASDIHAVFLSRADSAMRCAALYDVAAEVSLRVMHDKGAYNWNRAAFQDAFTWGVNLQSASRVASGPVQRYPEYKTVMTVLANKAVAEGHAGSFFLSLAKTCQKEFKRTAQIVRGYLAEAEAEAETPDSDRE